MDGYSLPRLALENLVKCYGETRVIDNVSLTIEPGTAHALLGENGAGKSTLLKMLSGVVRPTSGVVRVDGTELPSYTMAGAAWRASHDPSGTATGSGTHRRPEHVSGPRFAVRPRPGTHQNGNSRSGGSLTSRPLYRCTCAHSYLARSKPPTCRNRPGFAFRGENHCHG